jgi:hypothetical protein
MRLPQLASRQLRSGRSNCGASGMTTSEETHFRPARMGTPSSFSLRPPGSFALCPDPAVGEESTRDLKHISTTVREATRPFGVLGLILTGSVARGEGALIAQPSGISRWLSDLEFQVVIPDGRRTEEIDAALRYTEQAINLEPANRERGLRVGFNSIRAPQLARLRPAIFSREMLEHGKLLWGEPSALPLPRWWCEGRVDIPLLDAFRLLNNRIVQQLDARLRCEVCANTDLLPAYTLQKFWIDLATSLSVFLGCYRTSYRERRQALSQLLKAQPQLFGEIGQLLIARLTSAIEVKLGQAAPPVCSNEAFNESAAVAATVWKWETEQLLGRPGADYGWRSVGARLRQLEPCSQRARDWTRLLMRKASPRELLRNVGAALRTGSLANAIYSAACLLHFHWDDIVSGDAAGAEILTNLSSLFRIRPAPRAQGRRAVASAVIETWDRHLRFAPR